jgi:hypothetical protein
LDAIVIGVAVGAPREGGNKKSPRFRWRVLGVDPALWTFIVEEVKPPTNQADRVLRRAVLARRSFGWRSRAGRRFGERVLAVVKSLLAQSRSVPAVSQEVIQARRFKQLQWKG